MTFLSKSMWAKRDTMKMDEPDIKWLFEPRGIAVIGASHDPTKIGIRSSIISYREVIRGKSTL